MNKNVKSCLDRLRGIAEEHVVSWSKLRLREGLERDGLTPMEFARRRVESASTTMENLGNDARTEAQKVDWGRQNSQLKNLSSQKNSEIR